MLIGSATYTYEKLESKACILKLDTKKLTLHNIECDGNTLEWYYLNVYFYFIPMI